MFADRITVAARTAAVAAAVVGMSVVGIAGTAGAEPATQGTVTVTAGDILTFDQIAGQPQWKAKAQSRIEQGVWTFDDSGRFTYNSVDYNPLEGSYTVSGSTVSFSGEYNSSTAVGYAQTWMQGNIDFSVDPPVMTFEQAAGNAMGAYVNNTTFGANSTSAYQGKLTVNVSH